MTVMKNFVLVVLSMVAQLWTGFFNRKQDFYDRRSVTKTKLGYVVFVILALLATIGIMYWPYMKIKH
ncbi:hypothetical protein NV379_21360 [Paenibacillus sp. N1-5-1-14]|uniref:hypothetical protein n=1 Tax=Paenibacillus radicibacter TaxID=2972488 RepID=UPI0021597E87|nr:hypothetical protein [Paenibacillus radicibacter]MCR8645207.1 hypothetical protein [Paenibacillus radicibacter]